MTEMALGELRPPMQLAMNFRVARLRELFRQDILSLTV